MEKITAFFSNPEIMRFLPYVIAGIVLLAVVIWLIFFLRKRSKQKLFKQFEEKITKLAEDVFLNTDLIWNLLINIEEAIQKKKLIIKKKKLPGEMDIKDIFAGRVSNGIIEKIKNNHNLLETMTAIKKFFASCPKRKGGQREMATKLFILIISKDVVIQLLEMGKKYVDTNTQNYLRLLNLHAKVKNIGHIKNPLDTAEKCDWQEFFSPFMDMEQLQTPLQEHLERQLFLTSKNDTEDVWVKDDFDGMVDIYLRKFVGKDDRKTLKDQLVRFRKDALIEIQISPPEKVMVYLKRINALAELNLISDFVSEEPSAS